MQTVATNIRFPQHEYFQLKQLARFKNQSIAAVIRLAVKEHQKKIMSKKENWERVFNEMVNSRIKINISTVDLVHEGRKLE